MPGTYISLPTYTGWLEHSADTGLITAAPPIMRWTIGKDIEEVEQYFLNRNAIVIRLDDHTQPARVIKRIQQPPLA